MTLGTEPHLHNYNNWVDLQRSCSRYGGLQKASHTNPETYDVNHKITARHTAYDHWVVLILHSCNHNYRVTGDHQINGNESKHA
jgi:hypothetical protein